MLFTSPVFLIFLAVTFVVYYTPFLRRFQIFLLTAASFFFYSWEIPYYLPLLLTSVLMNAGISWFIATGKDHRMRILGLGIVLNLSLIAFFKYGGLFAGTIYSAAAIQGDTIFKHLPLPLGISFYTFQGISLIVDTYRDKDRSFIADSFPRHLLHTALFISLFPHQIAGPIVRASLLYPQIGSKTIRDIDVNGAVRALILGFFLKVVAADNLKDYTTWLPYPGFLFFSREAIVAMLFGYSMQIFADFAGYSLIAIGLARLFGYELCQNFNFPYLSASFREFWTRWHISLSGWLRDYLYIPLGGNRVGGFRTVINLLIVMGLGGLWHGPAWGFMIWGLAHGFFLVLERVATPVVPPRFLVWLLPVRIFFVFTAVSCAWALFVITDIRHLERFVTALFTPSTIRTDFNVIAGCLIYSLPVLLYHAAHVAKNRWPNFVKAEPYIFGTLVFLIVTNSGTGSRFIYFQF